MMMGRDNYNEGEGRDEKGDGDWMERMVKDGLKGNDGDGLTG